MYFLKCNKCGHLNPVKTEYMTFCSFCSKKLDNNYFDWIKVNPDKTFDDFKQIICTSELSDTPKSLSKSKTKSLKYWIGFALVAILAAIGQLGGEKITGFLRKPLFDKEMMAYASELNKSCPVMIDNATRFDNAMALPGNIFQYNYTLVSMVKDSLNIEKLKNYIEPTIINFVKSNPDMKTVRDHRSTLNYYYKDRTGIYLFTVTVKPEQYTN
jgi:hypothetical protein